MVSNLRVLHLITSRAMGGAEKFLRGLVKTQSQTGKMEVELCFFRESPNFFDFEGLGVPYHFVKFESSWRSVSAVRDTVSGLRRLIKERGFDILHSHLWLCDFLAGMAVQGTKTKHISHIHNTWDWYVERRIGFRLRRAIFSYVLRKSRARFIGCSNSAAEYTRRNLWLPADRFRVIPYGIDVKSFSDCSDPNDEPIVFGVAARFVPEKGHTTLLEAAVDLRRHTTNFSILFAGAGPLEGLYRTQVEDFGLSKHVKFLGQISDIKKFYSTIDVLVQPSHSAEGLPVAILESMAAGKAILATDIAGAREAVYNNANGWLIEPRSIKAISDTMLHAIISGRETIRKLGDNGRKIATEQFGLEKIEREVSDAYCDLVRNKW